MRSAFEARTATFDPGASAIWAVDGPLGAGSLSPRVLDLLDLAGAIYRLESQIPRRPTNPVKEWQVNAPVRDVAFWSASGGALLASVLRFLNRALWSFNFEARGKTEELSIIAEPRPVHEVVLFSGGMDSACGAGVHPGPREQVQLVFGGNQGGLQKRLAAELGYGPLTQWRLVGRRGKEGMNLIRAFMFLTLGAVVAETFGVSTIFQYENGVLAMAVPPSGSQVPTRHAHPEFHRRLERLFEAAFGRKMEIRNPFLLLTKREEAAAFAKAAGADAAEAVLRQTQTCWRLSQAHVGGRPKKPSVPCGVCTPCIVRRTARPFEAAKGAWQDWSGYAFDPKRNLLFVNVNNLPAKVRLVPRTEFEDPMHRGTEDGSYVPQTGAPYGLFRNFLQAPSALPCSPPPWGSLVAVDLAEGNIRWQVPLGSMQDFGGSHPGIPSGSISLGGPIVTAAGLVFIAGTVDSSIRAFDVRSGREVWRAALPASGAATPMTYMTKSGRRQFLVIAAGGHSHVTEESQSDTLVAFALP